MNQADQQYASMPLELRQSVLLVVDVRGGQLMHSLTRTETRPGKPERYFQYEHKPETREEAFECLFDCVNRAVAESVESALKQCFQGGGDA